MAQRLRAVLRLGDGAEPSDGPETHYRQALLLGGEDSRTLNNLGVALREQGEVYRAKSLFERAWTLDPLNVAARDNYESLQLTAAE